MSEYNCVHLVGCTRSERSPDPSPTVEPSPSIEERAEEIGSMFYGAAVALHESIVAGRGATGWRDAMLKAFILRTLQAERRDATEAEFERLYGKIVARISADIAGDFDAALDQYAYNVARAAERAALERAAEVARKWWSDALADAILALAPQEGGKDE